MYEVSGTPSTLNYLAYIVTVYSASHNVQNTYAVLIKIFKLKYWKNIEFIKVCSSPIFPLQIAPEHIIRLTLKNVIWVQAWGINEKENGPN